jgi:signal transduction histidine kinase
MKLLNYMSLYLAIAILLIVSLWGTIYYFVMLSDVKRNVDEGLLNSKYIILRNVKANPDILVKSAFFGNNYAIRAISKTNSRVSADHYQDTTRFVQREATHEPVRMLKTIFVQKNKRYELKIFASMVEEDDLISSLFKGLIGLYVAIIISSLIVQQLLVRKIWQPFRQLLDKLRNFQLDSDQAIVPIPTKISEFKEMNEVITSQMKQAMETYNSQKQFLENAAHELQTPLAISINRLELLVEEDLKEKDRKHVGQVIRTLERLSRLNKSLLLLTKIENRQFIKKGPVSINDIFRYLLAEFKDLSEQKSLTYVLHEEQELQWTMNRDLAIVLVSNLLKNAIMHNHQYGNITIHIYAQSFTIENSGESTALDEKELFERFKKQGKNKNSIGLGLAITKAIVNTYGLKINYRFLATHQFIVSS